MTREREAGRVACSLELKLIYLTFFNFFLHSLIPNDELDDSQSSKSEGSDQEDGIACEGKLQRQVEDDELGDGLKVTLSSDGSLDTNDSFNSHRHHPLNHQDAIGGFMGVNTTAPAGGVGGGGVSSGIGSNVGPVTIGATTDLLTPTAAAATRRRRKLPEIPKNKKCKQRILCCL